MAKVVVKHDCPIYLTLAVSEKRSCSLKCWSDVDVAGKNRRKKVVEI